MLLVKTHFTCILCTEHQSQVSNPGPMALLFFFVTCGRSIIVVYYYGMIAFLTHFQATNFRLFQTERVCRQQFQIS